MGSFSTGILLLGITLCYGAIGSFQLQAPMIVPSKGIAMEQYLLSAGLILIFAAMNFKVSAAPSIFGLQMYMMVRLLCLQDSWQLL
jgi:NADH-quinone oxidoreductase subunit N